MSIAERLYAAIAASTPVTLDILGTATELESEAAELAARPEAPALAAAFRTGIKNGPWSESHRDALLAFAKGLGRQRSYLALRDAVGELLRDQTMVDLAGRVLHDTLIPDRTLIADAPLLAGLRLDACLSVVVSSSVPPYRVLDLLTGPIDHHPDEFDDPLARAVGAAADIWVNPPERERFAAVLEALAARGSDDAAFEAIAHRLRGALAGEAKDRLLVDIRDARDDFAALAEHIESRDDAQAFAWACEAILAFERADSAALLNAASKARATAHRRALLSLGMHEPVRTSAKHLAELAWVSLAWRLETASMELEHDEFLNTWEAISAIINVYEADRRLTNLRTVSTLIQPRIVNELAQRETMARQLERAISKDREHDAPKLPTEMYELHEVVQRARSAGREASDDPEEPSPDHPYLRAILGPSARLLGDLPDEKRLELEAAVRQMFVGSSDGDRIANRTVERLFTRLVGELGQNAAFTGITRSNFSLLVLHTIRFLIFVGDTQQTYTAPITGSKDAPLEREFQAHFHQFLSATELVGRVGMEHANIAGGRADIIVTFDNAQRHVVEVKRELKNASRANLESAHLAQALEYQSTSEPFGHLLVLDLTDHSAGTPHLNDSIWVTHRTDDTGRIMQSTLVAVVRGNRPTPHAMG